MLCLRLRRTRICGVNQKKPFGGMMLATRAKLFGRVVSPMTCVLKGLFLVICLLLLLLLVTRVTFPLCLPCDARCAVAVCPPLCVVLRAAVLLLLFFSSCGQLDWSVTLYTLTCISYLFNCQRLREKLPSRTVECRAK